MSESEQSGAGRREVAYRLFATEYDDADLSYSESDEDRAPNYVITPTGARINRLFVVGDRSVLGEFMHRADETAAVDATGDPEPALADAWRDFWSVQLRVL